MKFLNFIKSKLISAFYTVIAFVVTHKITTAVILAAVAGVTAAAIVITSVLSAPVKIISSSDNLEDLASDTIASQPVVSLPDEEETVSSEESPVVSEEPVASEPPVASEAPIVSEPPAAPPIIEYQYNPNMTPDNNIFLDALAFTGYKLEVERASGRMFGAFGNYVRCSQKKGLGWLSNITYGGACSGYETDANGLPNIARFEKGGLVCATYVGYAYFNYLPNVAGIDTSMLTRPERAYDANAWYIAAQDWVNKGYSKYIEWTANDGGSINRDITFNEFEQIPIGSIICMQDWYNRDGHCTHVSIYAGYVNGYHWVTHVGNENGPEFCAIERMNRKPHPQWPLAIITTPNCIDFTTPPPARQ